MKRLILILSLTIFLILFFSPVKANNITFDMTNPIVVKAVQLNSLDIGYNDIDSSFHVGHRSSSIYTIDSFQPDFTELSSSSISCAVGKLCKYGDIAVYDDRLFFAGVSAISGSFYYGRTGYFNMTSRTFTTLNDITASSGYIPISDKINVDENRNMLWNTELVYAQNQDFGTNFNGEGVLSSKGLPTTYQIPDYYKTAYCSNIGFTFMLEKKSGHLKGIFLDENLDFLNAYALNMEEPYYPYSNLLNTICDENENTIYIVFTNSSLTTFIIKAYYYEQHLTKYGSQIVLTEMFADVVNMTQAHSDIDGSTRFILYPALSIDGNGFVHLFYQYYGSTGYVLEVLREPEYCNCNDWINDVCVKQLMKQSRTCIPELCTDSYRFVQSDYCELEYNRSLGIYQQYTKVISDSQSCETGMKNPHDYPEIRCDVSLNIPINCENILTNATMSLDINKASNIFYNLLGVNFSSHLCNPLYNCADFTEDCETGFNRTYYWNYPNYNAGETAQAGFLVKGGNCEQRGIYPIGYYGWSEYGLKGTLSYTCNITCGNRNTCVTKGLLDYSIQELQDCSLNESSKVICEFGCENGVCLDDVPTQPTQITGNVFAFAFNQLPLLLPSPLLLFVSFIISIGIGVLVAMRSNSEKFGMVIFIGFILVFSFIGWLPLIVGILIAMITALWLSKDLWGKLISK